jgi:DNA polymerase-3 subunit delta
VNKIINYFESNPKNNPIIPTISILFNFFSNLLLTYYAPDKSDTGLMKELNLKTVYQLKDYKAAKLNYSVFKCVEIIDLLRQYDVKLKGVGVSTSTTPASLLRELTYKIMH